MHRATIVKEEILEENLHFLAIYLKTENAGLVLLSENEDRLGTLAASVPPALDIRTQPFLSSILLGDRNTTTARMLAEHLASKTGKIGLVSIHLKTVDENKANPILMKLFKKVTTTSKLDKGDEGESIGI